MSHTDKPSSYWNPRQNGISSDNKERDKFIFQLLAVTRFIRTMIMNWNGNKVHLNQILLPILTEFHVFLTELVALIFQARITFIHEGNFSFPSRQIVDDVIETYYLPKFPRIGMQKSFLPEYTQVHKFIECFSHLHRNMPTYDNSLALSFLISSVSQL